MKIALPKIAQGTAEFFLNNDLSINQKVDLLRYGIDQGMNLIDTAEVYGNGLSEEIVGKAVLGRRGEVVLATKFSPQHHAYKSVIEAAEGSLKRFNTDYIDLYQLHWSNPSIDISETIEGLIFLKDQGKIREIGFCNLSYPELLNYQNYLGGDHISSFQAEYNLFERTVEYTGIIDYCRNSDIAFLAYSPLDQGRFANIGPERIVTLQKISESHGKTIPQIILKWIVSKPGVSAIVSTSSYKHLKENSDVCNFDLPLADLEAIDREFQDELVYVPTDEIQISLHGEFDHEVYQTIEQAMENHLGFSPSPNDLAKTMEDGGMVKPVRLILSEDPGYKYDLIGGRIRYWAWVIAHKGQLSIPAYVREDLTQ